MLGLLFIATEGNNGIEGTPVLVGRVGTGGIGGIEEIGPDSIEEGKVDTFLVGGRGGIVERLSL